MRNDFLCKTSGGDDRRLAPKLLLHPVDNTVNGRCAAVNHTAFHTFYRILSNQMLRRLQTDTGELRRPCGQRIQGDPYTRIDHAALIAAVLIDDTDCGSNVSGGQKQRLSIARAVAKDPEIYIFDDSFSALDYKTDVKLRAALQAETHGSTTLIVAQRISTILHADQIIVLDEGNIVGKGTHEELLKTCPVYQQIAKSQLSEDDLKKAREVSDHE